MPLYNKASFVRKSLESVFNQTNHDWELVIVDDGSTDGSGQVALQCIDEYKASNETVCPVSFISQANAGVGAARNHGARISSGEFFCFLDADDWWDKSFLEEMAAFIPMYPDAGLYASNYIYYKPGKTHVAVRCESGYFNYPEVYLANSAMPVWTGAVAVPRGVYDEFHGFPEGIKLGEDFLLWCRIALHHPFAFYDKPLAYYNNDVPVRLRATRNLHDPKYHMVFNLDPLVGEMTGSCVSPESKQTWTRLLDRLRINGLIDYWLDSRFHEVAAIELEKVDWTRFSDHERDEYEKSVLWLKAKRQFMSLAAAVRQSIIKLFVKR